MALGGPFPFPMPSVTAPPGGPPNPFSGSIVGKSDYSPQGNLQTNVTSNGLNPDFMALLGSLMMRRRMGPQGPRAAATAGPREPVIKHGSTPGTPRSPGGTFGSAPDIYTLSPGGSNMQPHYELDPMKIALGKVRESGYGSALPNNAMMVSTPGATASAADDLAADEMRKAAMAQQKAAMAQQQPPSPYDVPEWMRPGAPGMPGTQPPPDPRIAQLMALLGGR
jgi:hypothetical protein